MWHISDEITGTGRYGLYAVTASPPLERCYKIACISIVCDVSYGNACFEHFMDLQAMS